MLFSFAGHNTSSYIEPQIAVNIAVWLIVRVAFKVGALG